MDTFERTIYQLIGKKIREARNIKELSQGTLSEIINLSRASISNIETGRQQPPIHVLFTISTALGVDISYILPTMTEIEQYNYKKDYKYFLEKENISSGTKDIISNLIREVHHDKSED